MDIFTAVDGHIGNLFAREDQALLAALREAEDAGLPDINVSPVLGKFLFFLAKMADARRILEIGTLAGYSAIWLGRALPDDGFLLTIEADPLHAKIARRNIARAKLFGAVEVREGLAAPILQEMAAAGEAPFDMIFIDADKESYLEYFELSLKLSRPGTLIVADNMVRGGAILDPAAHVADSSVRGVTVLAEALASNPSVEATMVQWVGLKGHDGLALAIVKRAR
jgi:predicted O-methyltransferase YrrM